jgi:hypothetical protein
MTQEMQSAAYPAASITPKLKGAKKQLSLEDIADLFQALGTDISDIGKLTAQERGAANTFLSTLKELLAPLLSPVEISLHVLPIEMGLASQIRIHPSGHLAVTFTDGHSELLDLSEMRYREVMMAVIDDVVPKLDGLVVDAAKRLRVASETGVLPIEELPAVEAAVSASVQLVEPAAPTIPEAPLPPEAPVEPPVILALPAPAEMPLLTEQPTEASAVDLLAERNLQIEAATAETLSYLDLLGAEVFEQAPVSRYFGDWLVNLRQVLLSYESNPLIGGDEAFTAQYTQIFADIQAELSKRIAQEATLQASQQTLQENRQLLNKIEEGYANQTRELLVKGKSVLECLLCSVQSIEGELEDVRQTKTSYRHPLQLLAKDQKVSELTQRLYAAKKRLALAVGSVAVAKTEAVDAKHAGHSSALAQTRRAALEYLTRDMQGLAAHLEMLKEIRTGNPLRKVAIQQQIYETEEALYWAQKRLAMAQHDSSVQLEPLREEYEKKKQATLGRVASLEKNLASMAVDDSAEVRRAAAGALSEAVRALSERKSGLPLSEPKVDSAS